MGWNYLGVSYTFKQAITDLVNKKWIYGQLLRGIIKGEIRQLSELCFPLVRVVFLFKGNNFNKKFKF